MRGWCWGWVRAAPRRGSTGPAAACGWPPARPLRRRHWTRLWLSVDPATGAVLLGQAEAGGAAVIAEAEAPGLALPDGGEVLVAAEDPALPRRHFNGKIEAPAILRGWIADWPQALEPADATPLAAWDFAAGIDSADVLDAGPQGCTGAWSTCRPAAMVGARWTGARDLLAACAAATTPRSISMPTTSTIAAGSRISRWTDPGRICRSGAYALHLACDGRRGLAAVLRAAAARGAASRRVAFLASTFTYQAYANHAARQHRCRLSGARRRMGRVSANPDQYPVYGASTYNRASGRQRHRLLVAAAGRC